MQEFSRWILRFEICHCGGDRWVMYEPVVLLSKVFVARWCIRANSLRRLSSIQPMHGFSQIQDFTSYVRCARIRLHQRDQCRAICSWCLLQGSKSHVYLPFTDVESLLLLPSFRKKIPITMKWWKSPVHYRWNTWSSMFRRVFLQPTPKSVRHSMTTVQQSKHRSVSRIECKSESYRYATMSIDIPTHYSLVFSRTWTLSDRTYSNSRKPVEPVWLPPVPVSTKQRIFSAISISCDIWLWTIYFHFRWSVILSSRSSVNHPCRTVI